MSLIYIWLKFCLYMDLRYYSWFCTITLDITFNCIIGKCQIIGNLNIRKRPTEFHIGLMYPCYQNKRRYIFLFLLVTTKEIYYGLDTIN